MNQQRQSDQVTRMIPESDLIWAHAMRLKMWIAIIITIALITVALVAFFWIAVSKEIAIAVLIFMCMLAIGLGFARLNDASQERDRRFLVDFQRAQQDLAMQSGMMPDMQKVMTSWLTDTGKSVIAVEKAAQVEEVKQLAKQPRFDDDGDIEINTEEMR